MSATQRQRSVGSPTSKSDKSQNASSDSASVAKRLQTELMSLMTSSDAGISAFPDGDNIFSWVGTIEGAKGTAYENLKYSLTLRLRTSTRSKRRW